MELLEINYECDLLFDCNVAEDRFVICGDSFIRCHLECGSLYNVLEILITKSTVETYRKKCKCDFLFDCNTAQDRFVVCGDVFIIMSCGMWNVI